MQMPKDEVRDGIVAAVDAAVRESESLQSRLSKRCALTDYSGFAKRSANGSVVWTEAFQRARNENEVVVVPASSTPYLVDGTPVVASNRRIEAEGATVRLATDTRTLMLRNAFVMDGTLTPVPRGFRDSNIVIRGGVWEVWCSRRRGYGSTGRMNEGPRELGNFFGVLALFYFGNCNHVSVTEATFRHAGAFAVQCGDGDAFRFEDIVFDRFKKA